MKMKKIISLLLTAAMLLSLTVLPGCGDSKDNNDSTPDDTPQDSDNDDTYTGEVIEITVGDLVLSATGTNRWVALRQQQFEKDHPEIKVNHISASTGDTTNMVEYLTTLFMGDNSPVYYVVSSTYYMRDLYNSDLAADISPYISDDAFDGMYDFAAESVKYGDAIIGYPATLEVPLLGFFNENLEAAGYDPATFTCETWDDYYEVAEKMTTDSIKGSSLYVYEYFLWPSNWFLSNSAEPAVQNDDGTITLQFTNNNMIETLEYFKRLYSNGLTNQNITYTQIADMLNLIYNKKVASFTFYPNWLDNIEANGITAEDITLTLFPKGPSYDESSPASNVIVSGAVFNSQKSSEELQAAITYYEYMNGLEAKEDLYAFMSENRITDFSLSPYVETDWKAIMADNNIPQNWIDTTEKALQEGYVSPLHSTAFTTYLTTQFGSLIRDDIDMEETLQSAQDTAQREWLDDFNAYLK